MYLWIVIATFIAILASFNLSVRPDMDRVFAETKAGVVITKFRALHNGVRDYFNSQSPDKTGLTYANYYPGDGVNVQPKEDGSINALTVDEVAPFLPFGYAKDGETLDDIASITGGGEIVSKVFCFDEGNTAEQCVSGVDGSCCSNQCIDDSNCSSIYVVSFTQMPSRWVNKISNMPSVDMISALSHMHGYGKDFGYTEVDDGKVVLSGGRFIVDNSNGAESFDKWEIFGAVVNDEDFQRLDCDKENYKQDNLFNEKRQR